MTTPFAFTPNPLGRGARFAFSFREKVAACNAAG
jgi:hypothetical protein